MMRIMLAVEGMLAQMNKVVRQASQYNGGGWSVSTSWETSETSTTTSLLFSVQFVDLEVKVSFKSPQYDIEYNNTTASTYFRVLLCNLHFHPILVSAAALYSLFYCHLIQPIKKNKELLFSRWTFICVSSVTDWNCQYFAWRWNSRTAKSSNRMEGIM